MKFDDNTYPLPGWLLRIKEISNGHYQVSLCDQNGRRIELSCGDDELPEKVKECIDWAVEGDAGSSFRQNHDAYE